MEKSTEIKNSELLRTLIHKGAGDKKLVLTDTVSNRIGYELSIIERQGFTDHFILYSRIAEICNELNLLRSCGRGNSINSMVNYCLDITKINPVEENLLFETFVRPKQKHLPDIDIDIPVGYQTNVIERLKQKHPEYNIYPIAISIEEDVNKDKNDKGIIVHNNIAYRIHPCGIIITHEKLTDYIFLHEGQEFYHVLDVHNDPIFNNNKIDILGLSYLNRLQLIVNEISEEYHPYQLPLNDKQVFDFIASGDLKNIFFFNSPPDISQIFAQSKPNSINDLLNIKLVLHPTFSKPHSLSCSILGYWGCFYKTHFRKEFEMAFSKELTEY